jgi:hypothetical protein
MAYLLQQSVKNADITQIAFINMEERSLIAIKLIHAKLLAKALKSLHIYVTRLQP